MPSGRESSARRISVAEGRSKRSGTCSLRHRRSSPPSAERRHFCPACNPGGLEATRDDCAELVVGWWCGGRTVPFSSLNCTVYGPGFSKPPHSNANWTPFACGRSCHLTKRDESSRLGGVRDLLSLRHRWSAESW